ncbi:MAG: glutathione S-transferase family protein [Ectothiorhodospiraceae bacterium]|nr:glutathione S-transferase family protein [Ectothiorhodospiraceae bacterium]
MTASFTLVSHQLCPYVQRVAISLIEKKVAFHRVYVDLSNIPDWFTALSPLGKVPVLNVDTGSEQVPLFESNAILEYLEDTLTPPLHPLDALKRAEHRSWIEYGSSVLDDIGGLYSASNAEIFDAKVVVLKHKFQRLESRLSEGNYFDGDHFSLVDTVFSPVFRYFDVFDQIDEFGILKSHSKVLNWRRALSERESTKTAVTEDYETLLFNFLKSKNSHLSKLIG